MVQVDIFWTFAIGSSFAVAASKQLKKEEKPFDNRFFLKTLLFLSVLFVPSGAYLVTQHPGWETMFALYPYLVDLENAAMGVIPRSAGLLVAIFSMTNILSGMLGFYLAYKLIQKNKMMAAHALWIFGYFMMFFILMFGWDGTGWERFTYAGTWYEWHQWKVMGGANIYTWTDFFTSPVFYGLMVMGVFIVPPMAYIYYKWPREWRDH